MAGCAVSSTSTRPPLPGDMIKCVEPKPPKDAVYDSIALALGDAITRFYECKAKHDFLVKVW